jgi:type I restriction enzyme S subunit
MSAVKLDELVSIVGGGTPSRDRSEYWSGNIPWVTVKDFKDIEISSSQEKITPSGLSASASNLIPAGNILVPTRMALGKAAVNSVDVAINQDVKALIVKDEMKIDKRYLLRFLLSKAGYLESRGKGATVKGITLDVLKSLEIPLPPLEEQKRIAAILDKADSLRRKRQQALQLADDFLRATFLDLFGDPVTNPKGWPVFELSELIDPNDRLNYGVVQPGDDDPEGVPLVRSGDLSDGTPNVDMLRKVSSEIDLKHRKSRLKGSEILIACVGSIGRVGWVTKEMIGWNIARAVTRIPIRQDVNREYVFRYLQSPIVQSYFEQETRAVAQPTLNVGLIAKTPIAIPPQELQQEFLNRYRQIQKFKMLLSHSVNEKNNLLDSLSLRAFE